MAEIVFDPLLASPHTDSEGDVPLPALSTFGSELPNVGLIDLPGLLTSGEGVNLLHALLSLPGLEVFAAQGAEVFTTYLAYGAFMLPALTTFGTSVADDIPTPQDAQGVFDLPGLTTYGEGFMHYDAQGEFDLPALGAFGFDGGPGGYGFATLPPLRTHASEEVVTPDTYIFGMVGASGLIIASNTLLINDTLDVGDELLSDLFFVLESRLQAGDNVTMLQMLLTTLQSSFVARDYMRFVLEALILDGLTLTDETEITPEAVLALASALAVSDEAFGLLSAIQTVASVLTVLDQVRGDMALTITSAADFVDLLETHLSLVMALASEAQLLADLEGAAFMTALVSSGLVVADGVEGLLALLMSLEDTVTFALRVTTPDGDVFAGYVLNTRNAAMSTLDNFAFNSFARVKSGGREITLAARSDGIYMLGGDTDDGDPIRSLVRLGLTDFGSSQLKRVANAYLGYTSDGRLLLKVVTTDGGRKKENWYSLKPRSANSPVDGRLDIVKGLTARYWGWTLENIDGADFQLDDLRVWPAFLGRRKSGR